MSGALSIGGVVSGIDTEGMLSKLEQIAKASVTTLQTKRATLQAKSDAWSVANTRLLAIKEQAGALTKLSDNLGMLATSSDSTLVGVSATSEAAAGNYNFTIDHLSTYHQFTAQSYTDQDVTSVGTGTLSITIGEKTTDITVDGLTLTGIRDAINQSDSGANAMIISENASSYRLIVTSQTIGSAGKMTIANTLSGANALTLTQSQDAQDTQLTFGSGASAVTVTRSGNTLTDVIPGVTLSLKSGSEGKSASVQVTKSYEMIKQTITGFANQYNTFLDYLAQQNKYDSDTGSTGLLFGESQLQQVASDLATSLTAPIDGLPSTMNSLSQIGITTDSSGKIVIDNAKLQDSLTTDYEGVMRLFSATGASSSTQVKYLSSTTDTQASGTTGYAIKVVTPASQAHLTLGTGMVAPLTADETVTVNGTNISLTTGMSQLEVLAAINAKSSTTGIIASLTDASGMGTGNYLTFTSKEYGSAQHIAIVSSAATGGTGIGTTTLRETDAGGVAGVDIIGTIDGVAATGSGQVLTCNNGRAKGLQLRITATAAGELSPIVVTKGIGPLIGKALTYITDSSGKMGISATQASLTESISSLDDQITAANNAVTREMDRMRSQFNAMEVALGKLQNQNAQLSSLISQLSSSASSSSSD